MTDKEKAEAYDEALERARKMLNMILDNELLGFPDQIREIFPQLAESEDERIRKILLKMAKVPRKEIYEHEGITKEQAIAYLEKQKGNQYFVGYTKGYSEGQLNPKQKEPVVDKEGMYYYLGGKFIYCGYPATEENPYDFAMSQQEKQKEQNEKPSKPELKTPEWVCGGWDDEYMINTVIGRYSLRAEVAKKRDDTHEYNLSKSMENWLRNVVKPLILEKQKENPEEPKIAFGDWGDKEKQEAIFTCLKYMRFIKKITNQEYDDLTKWLNNNLVSNVLEKDGWTIANEQTDTIKEDYYGAFLRGEMRGYLRGTRQKEQKPLKVGENAYFDPNTERWFIKKEQKPAEWSEEDESNWHLVLNEIKDCELRCWFYSVWERLTYRKPHWKPSKEQMKLLLNIEGDLRAFQYNDKANALAELYEQLKRM